MKKILPLILLIFVLSKISVAQNFASIDSLLSVLKGITEDDTSKAKILYTISRTLIINSEFVQAKQYATQSLTLSEKLNWGTGIIKASSCIANINRNEGRYEESLKYEFEALKILEKKEPDADRASVYNNIGVSYKNLGKLDEALKYHNMSLTLKKNLKDEHGVANSHNNIGLIYLNKHDYVKSFEHLFEALKWGEKTNNSKILSDCYNHIGLVYKHQENYNKALEFYTKALSLQLETGNKNGAANAYNNIGVVQKHLGNYNEGIKNFLEALKIVEKTENQKIEALTYNNLGNLYKRKGEIHLVQKDSAASFAELIEAERYFLSSVKILREIRNWKGLSGALGNLGSLSHTQKKYFQASAYFQEAIQLCEQYKVFDVLRDVSYNSSRLDSTLAKNASSPEERLQHWHNAYLNYRRYAQLQDSLVNENVKKEISEMQTRYDTEKKDEEIKLLKAENDLKELSNFKNKTLLKTFILEKKQKENELTLLQKSKIIDELELIKVRQDLEQARYKSSITQSNLALLEKERSLKNQQLKNQANMRNALITGIILIIIASVLAFSRYNLRKKLEKQMAVEIERQRISADLHDDLGSGLSKISLLSDMLVSQVNSKKAREEASKIALVSKSLIENISEIVWSLNTTAIQVNDLIAFIRRYTAEYFENCDIIITNEVAPNIPGGFLSAYVRRNIFCSVKEALHNIIKHSQANKVIIKYFISGETLIITIFDNGKGFNVDKDTFLGNGLANMKKRMAQVNGAFFIENHVGTTVILKVPLGT